MCKEAADPTHQQKGLDDYVHFVCEALFGCVVAGSLLDPTYHLCLLALCLLSLLLQRISFQTGAQSFKRSTN